MSIYYRLCPQAPGVWFLKKFVSSCYCLTHVNRSTTWCKSSLLLLRGLSVIKSSTELKLQTGLCQLCQPGQITSLCATVSSCVKWYVECSEYSFKGSFYYSRKSFECQMNWVLGLFHSDIQYFLCLSPCSRHLCVGYGGLSTPLTGQIMSLLCALFFSTYIQVFKSNYILDS